MAETNTTENSKFVVVMVQLVQTDGVFFNPNKQSLHWISIHFNILVKSTFTVTIMLLSLELKLEAFYGELQNGRCDSLVLL